MSEADTTSSLLCAATSCAWHHFCRRCRVVSFTHCHAYLPVMRASSFLKQTPCRICSVLLLAGIDSVRGTLAWIAPEVLREPQCVNESADVYSFGVSGNLLSE